MLSSPHTRLGVAGGQKFGSGTAWLLLSFVMGCAFFLGLVAVFLPWFIVVPAMVVPLFVAAAWLRPEYAMAIMVTVVCGFLPDFLLPRLPLFGGTLRSQDIFLLFVALICLFKHGGAIQRWWPGLKPFVLPLVVLLAVVAFNVAYSKFSRGNPSQAIVEELRPFIFLTLPLWLVMLVQKQATLNRFFWALVVGAALLAIAQILQAVFQLPLVHGGRYEEATIGRETITDVIRSTVPGIYLIIFALLAVVARYLAGLQGLLSVSVLAAAFTGALLFTFGRALWGATLIGLLLVALHFRGLRAFRLAVVGVVVAVLALGTIAVLKPRTAETMLDRALSVTEEGSSSTSLGWRIDESRMAWARIRQQPFLGIGLGGAYKAVTFQRGWEGEERVTHNSHVFIQLKMGAIGTIALAWLLWVYWYQAGLLLRRLARDDGNRPTVVACRVLLPLVLITATIRPEWNEAATVTILSLAIGLIAVLRNLTPVQAAAKGDGAQKWSLAAHSRH